MKAEPKRRGRLALRIVLIALVGLLAGGALYQLNARRVLHNAMPMPLGVGTAVVLSGSMEPVLSVNDLILVRAAQDYEAGDIVVYQSGSELIIHRIIAIDGDRITTQGDANNAPDAPFDRAAIKGRLSLRVPYVGLLVRFMQTTVGRIAVIALALFLLNRSWTREKSEDDKKLEELKAEIRRLKAQQEEDD